MQIEVLKSKIHRTVITEANLDYVGSITLDKDLIEAANIIENDRRWILKKRKSSNHGSYSQKKEINYRSISVL